MRIHSLRSAVGSLMLVTHVVAIMMLTYFFFIDAFFFSQYTTLVAIVSPVLGVYSVAYLNHVRRTYMGGAPRSAVKLEFAIIVLVSCAVLSLSVITLIYMKGFSIVQISFEETKGLIAVFEVVFGGIASRLYFFLYE